MKWLLEASSRYGMEVHAWVLMTNHFHLLVTPIEENAISLAIQHTGRIYVPYFNQTHERTGALFEGRFRASLIEEDEYLLNCLRYIELNPVRAGMVNSAAEFRWSSFKCHAFGTNASIWTPHRIYLGLGGTQLERQCNYRELIQEDLNQESLSNIRSSLQRGIPTGSSNFAERLEQLTGVPQRLSRRGRKRRVPER